MTISGIHNSKAATQIIDKNNWDDTINCLSLDDNYLKRLSKSVFLASRLPENDDYVSLLGNGYETSNRDAIYTLIVKNTDLLGEIRSCNHLEKILEIIKNRFSDIDSIMDV